MPNEAPAPIAPTLQSDPDGQTAEIFALPLDEAYLDGLLRDVFTRYWDRLVFGPMTQGGAFEFRCPEAPSRMGLLDGYLTIFFGRSHFHLCIGDNKGSAEHPTPEALRAHRRTARAEFFRLLNAEAAPVSWGLRLFNGAGEQQITIFFPNPFLDDDDRLIAPPDWSRLAVWEDLSLRYLGRGPDPKDRSGKGFAHS